MRRILKPGHNCWDIAAVRRAGLLIDGKEYYRAFYRAAAEAKKYILMAGWQFDSDERLLRGEDADGVAGDVRLLPFLDSLCAKNEQLQVYMLAWDYSPIYVLDREWFQELLVNWKTNERLRFRFDGQHPVGGSHHQKFVVIDGRIAFVGGLDLCCSRWDDSAHRPHDPDRVNSDGKSYEPFHDIQSCLVGPVAEKLTDLFRARWLAAFNEELSLSGPALESEEADIEPTIGIPASQAAISRTQGSTLASPEDSIKEIRQLYLDAIASAEKLIYMENQYLSSRNIHDALIRRMEEPGREKLQIVIVLQRRPNSLMEEIALGIAQSKILSSLKETAQQTGHSLGIYYPASKSASGEDIPTYIHSKLLIVDDRFLSVGSANASNRSMGLDSELNVSFEAASPDDADLVDSIRRARVSLLFEHAGIESEEAFKALERIEGLVDFLDPIASSESHRLRFHPMDTSLEQNPAFKAVVPEGLDLDPSKPLFEETAYETFSSSGNGFFAGGISFLTQWLTGREEKGSGAEKAEC